MVLMIWSNGNRSYNKVNRVSDAMNIVNSYAEKIHYSIANNKLQEIKKGWNK